MNILEHLRQLQQQAKQDDTQRTGDAYISDSVTYSALFRAGIDNETIQEVLREPVESRDWYINYFENQKNKV